MNDLKNLLENSYNNLEETLGISNLSQGISFIKNRENFEGWENDLDDLSGNELAEIDDLEFNFKQKLKDYNDAYTAFYEKLLKKKDYIDTLNFSGNYEDAERVGAHLAYPSDENYLQNGRSSLSIGDGGNNYRNCADFVTDEQERTACNTSKTTHTQELQKFPEFQTVNGGTEPQNIIRTLYTGLVNKNNELIAIVRRINNIINKVDIDDASVRNLLDSKKESNLEIMKQLQLTKNELNQYEPTYNNKGKRHKGTGGQYSMSITRKAQFEDIILKNKSENLKIYLWGSVALVTLLVAMRLNN